MILKHEPSIQNFFISYAAVIFGAQSTGSVFSYAPEMGKSKQAAEMLKSLFDRNPDIDSWSDTGAKLGNIEGSIEFRDVEFHYRTRSAKRVLKGINLTFKPGQYVALVGPSGCGKSTIISLIERFYDPTKGAIFMDGQDISSLNLRDCRSHIALVSQEPVLYSGTIRENILLGTEAEVSEERVINACKDANIHDFIVRLCISSHLNTLFLYFCILVYTYPTFGWTVVFYFSEKKVIINHRTFCQFHILQNAVHRYLHLSAPLHRCCS